MVGEGKLLEPTEDEITDFDELEKRVYGIDDKGNPKSHFCTPKNSK